MIEIKGKYNTALVYSDTLEDSARDQIQGLCDQEFASGAAIRIMPDVHAGAGCVIGFTADLGERVIPNIVGVDIGCGMLTVELGKQTLDYARLDQAIRECVPSGNKVHEGRVVRFPALTGMHAFRQLRDTKRIERSLGTLGGGNHFIEVDRDEEGNHYLVIHTGSRNLGKQVAELYQQLAIDLLSGREEYLEEKARIIAEYKRDGRRNEIQQALRALESGAAAQEASVPKNLCYLTGIYRKQYLEDMAVCQDYATLNRRTIADLILGPLFGKTIEDFPSFETVHNYIDHDRNLVRKGAVSADKGERLLIPINMRDGSLVCEGKGNPDWNFSAPHGAGRLFSRNAARSAFDLSEFAAQMEGIYTTSVSLGTLDECPMAYKSMDHILANISPTATVERVIKPVYNFKAGE